MKAHELIAALNAGQRSATVYVEITDPETGNPVLVPIVGVAPADSAAYGSAVVLETED